MPSTKLSQVLCNTRMHTSSTSKSLEQMHVLVRNSVQAITESAYAHALNQTSHESETEQNMNQAGSILVIRINLLQLKTSQPADRTDAVQNSCQSISITPAVCAMIQTRCPTYNRSHGFQSYFSICPDLSGTPKAAPDSTPVSVCGLGALYSYAFNINCFTYSADTFCHVMNLIALKPQTHIKRAYSISESV